MSSVPLPPETVLEVSEFVALTNQVLEYALPTVTIRGEVTGYKVSKGRWVYFNLKDETASVRFFGTVYQLQTPIEDGMLLRVVGTPRLHPLYGFTVTVVTMQPEGEGTIRRAAELLQARLAAEGLFDEGRKRTLPYPPDRIGLVTSTESAAYADFLKIVNARWGGVVIECIDVQVQGESAPQQIIRAIEQFNQQAETPDVLVVTRGGGSADDLYAFNTEPVVRAVAGSRIPTLVAIGHEVDISLAELAADRRASTPSNAAELLVPTREDVKRLVGTLQLRLEGAVIAIVREEKHALHQTLAGLDHQLGMALTRARSQILASKQLLEVLDPRSVVKRGYAIVRQHETHKIVQKRSEVKPGDIVDVEMYEGSFNARVQ